jgi:hypothetical protein
MQKPIFPAELAAAIECIGKERGLEVANDTHYDAGNYEISWWSGWVFYRLDFQPRSDASIQVTLSRDHFQFSRASCGGPGVTLPCFRTSPGWKLKSLGVCPLASRQRGIVEG